MNAFPKSLVLFGFLMSMAVLTEYFQLLVPKRTFEFGDMLANALGILVFGIPSLCLVPFKNPENFRTLFTGQGVTKVGDRVMKIRKRPH